MEDSHPNLTGTFTAASHGRAFVGITNVGVVVFTQPVIVATQLSFPH